MQTLWVSLSSSFPCLFPLLFSLVPRTWKTEIRYLFSMYWTNHTLVIHCYSQKKEKKLVLCLLMSDEFMPVHVKGSIEDLDLPVEILTKAVLFYANYWWVYTVILYLCVQGDIEDLGSMSVQKYTDWNCPKLFRTHLHAFRLDVLFNVTVGFRKLVVSFLSSLPKDLMLT